MARPTLYTHRKFRRLCRTLQSRPLALGVLEFMWAAAYEAGDDKLGDEADVEAATSWEGEPGLCCTALRDAGFIDLRADGYYVHDLWHHAPDYVRKRREREQKRREKADPMASSVQSVTGQCPVVEVEVPVDQTESDTTPAPAPAPTHKNNTSSAPPPAARRRRAVADYSDPFTEAWGQYPHFEQRSSKRKAWQVWRRDGLEDRLPDVLAWIESMRYTESWSKDGGRFVPAMEVWLNRTDFREQPPYTETGGRYEEAENRRITPEEKAARIAALRSGA